jgi:hypothetical protein
MKEVRCVFMFAVLTLWMALPVGAQNAKRGITMSLVNESLASALRKVQQKSDYKVSFVIEDVKPYTTTVHLKNAIIPNTPASPEAALSAQNIISIATNAMIFNTNNTNVIQPIILLF